MGRNRILLITLILLAEVLIPFQFASALKTEGARSPSVSISAQYNDSSSTLTISGSIQGGSKTNFCGNPPNIDAATETIVYFIDSATYAINNGGPSGIIFYNVDQQGQNGVCSSGPDNSLLWTYNYSQNIPLELGPGTYTVTATVRDSFNPPRSTNASANFTVPAPAPTTGTVCVISNVATHVGVGGQQTLSFNVLANTLACSNSVSLGSYTATGDPLSGYTGPTYDPLQTQSLTTDGQTITFSLTYTATGGGGAVCGNGVVESGEQCDAGGANGSCPATCSTSCTTNTCAPPPSGISGSITCNGQSGSCTISTGGSAVYVWNSSGANNCNVLPYDPAQGWTGTSGMKTDSTPATRTVQLDCWNATTAGVVDAVQVTVTSGGGGGGGSTVLGCEYYGNPGDDWQSSCSVPTSSTLYQIGASCASGISRIWSGDVNDGFNDYLCTEGWNPGSCGQPGVDGFNRFTESTQFPNGKKYQLECMDGSSSGVVTVTVNPPSADLKANGSDGPITVQAGGSVALSWTSSYVDVCAGSWDGNVPTSGSGSVAPLTTTTYTLTCVNSQHNVTKQDSVTVNVTSPPPNPPANVTVTPPNYCVSGPAATVGWIYSDPSGSPQSAYEVQMDEQGSFQDPEYQTGKVLSNSNSNFTGQGVLLFNKTYKTRARVWNSYDAVSEWTVVSGNFDTPSYAYPQTDFNWTANGILNNPSPPLDKPVDFTDQTIFNGNPNGRRWDWVFGDGGTSTIQNPSRTYVAEGSYYVTLTATDNANQVCSKTKGPLIIQKPIPRWREVAPR